jgi:hypothetical protein
MTWDPARRLVLWRVIEPKLAGTGKHARWMVERWDDWTGTSEPYAILVDCRGMASTDALWRATLHDYIKTNRHRVVIAWFNASAMIRVTLEMFLVGTHAVDAAVFNSESDARAWLMRRSDSCGVASR